MSSTPAQLEAKIAMLSAEVNQLKSLARGTATLTKQVASHSNIHADLLREHRAELDNVKTTTQILDARLKSAEDKLPTESKS